MPLVYSGATSDEPQHRKVNDQQVVFPPYFLIIDICIVKLGESPAKVKTFPAVIDTGFESTFVLNDRQLQDWAGRSVEEFPYVPNRPEAVLTFANGGSKPIRYRSASVQLCSNVPPASFIPLTPEFIHLSEQAAPKYPLVGMRALSGAGLKIDFDLKALSFRLST